MDQPIAYKSFNHLRPALFAALAAAALLVAACGDRAAEPEVAPAEQAASPQTVPAGAVVTVPVTVYVTVPVTIPVPVTVEAAAPVVEPAPTTEAPASEPAADTGTTPITTAPAATAPVTASAPVTLSVPATTSAATTTTAAAGTPTVAPTRTPLPPATERPTGAFAAWWEGDPALQEALGLARSVEPAAVQLAYQPFERGMMVWRADDQRIYALLADGTWESYDDSFREGDVERDGSISAPSQLLLQPVRGFGKIWRDDRTLQSRIGWGTDEESPAQGVIQFFDNGFILRINARTFAVYDVGDGNRWTERPN